MKVSEAVQQAGEAPRRRSRPSVKLWAERAGVALIVLGILGLIQPWVQDFYTNGFTVLLIGTVVFIIASHV